jgi:hypothetical protein
MTSAALAATPKFFGVNITVRADHFRDGEPIPNIAAGRMDVDHSFFRFERLQFVFELTG